MSQANNRVVIVGAGIAGLTSALLLNQKNYDVTILEKRTLNFTRFNKITMKVECESVLKKLGLYEEFLSDVGSRIESHRYWAFNQQNQEYEFVFENNLSDLKCDDNQIFDSQTIDDQLNNDGLYGVSIGKMQSMLAKNCLQRGVKILTECEQVSIKKNGNYQIINISIKGQIQEFETDFVFITDGASGQTLAETMNETVNDNHFCQNEKWIFGTVQYKGPKSFVDVCLKRIDENFIEMWNAIYHTGDESVCIAVSVNKKDLSKQQMQDLMMNAAEKLWKINNIQEKPQIKIIGNWCIEINNRIMNSHTYDDNILFAGDRAGTSSPLPGLGASLSFTAYPYAIVRFVETTNRQLAIQEYELFCKQVVNKWHRKAEFVKRLIYFSDTFKMN